MLLRMQLLNAIKTRIEVDLERKDSWLQLRLKGFPNNQNKTTIDVREVFTKMKLSKLKFKKEVFWLIKTRVGTIGVDESEGQCPKTLYLYYTIIRLCCLISKSSFSRLLGPQVNLTCTTSKTSDFAWTSNLLKAIVFTRK